MSIKKFKLDLHTYVALINIVSAVFSLGMTYMLELCGSNWTTLVGMGYEFFWVIGWLSLGGLAYVLTNWRHLIMATSAPGLLVVFYYCILLQHLFQSLRIAEILCIIQ